MDAWTEFICMPIAKTDLASVSVIYNLGDIKHGQARGGWAEGTCGGPQGPAFCLGLLLLLPDFPAGTEAQPGLQESPGLLGHMRTGHGRSLLNQFPRHLRGH